MPIQTVLPRAFRTDLISGNPRFSIFRNGTTLLGGLILAAWKLIAAV